MSGRLESRARTPSCRSMEASQSLVAQAVNKELVRQTDLLETWRPERRRSHHSGHLTSQRRRSLSSSSGGTGGPAMSFREAHGPRNSARNVWCGLVGDRLAEGFSNVAHFVAKHGVLCSQATMPPFAATYWVTIAKPALREEAAVTVGRR
jgi:hypothetical protein